MGFGNTAVHRAAWRKEMCGIPGDTTAADWWFFTMILATGARARRTKAPVVGYRVYEKSTLGSGVANSVAALRRKAEIAAEHYASLPESDGIVQRMRATRALLRQIELVPATCLKWADQIGSTGVWFDVVTNIGFPVEILEN